MKRSVSDVAIGAAVIAVIIVIGGYLLTRADDCLDRARDFVSRAPAITARSGKVISAESSSWLSGQTVARAGERTFYFVVRGERARVNAIVSADRASCTCRVESVY